MTKPKIILGRGGTGVICDVQISEKSAVSRQHFSITFAPEHEAIQVENLSKNGILVNGQFLTRFSAPMLLRYQAEITYGKPDDMKLTLLLPAEYQSLLTKKKKNDAAYLPLLQYIGNLLVNGNREQASCQRLVSLMQSHYDKRVKHIDTAVLFNSIRHVLTQNDHIFQVVPSMVPSEPPRFSVRAQERTRFIQFAQLQHQEGPTPL